MEFLWTFYGTKDVSYLDVVVMLEHMRYSHILLSWKILSVLLLGSMCVCGVCVCAVFVWKSHLRHSMTEINAPKCIPLFGCLEMATSDFYGILNKYSYIFGFLLINSIVSSGSKNTWQDNRIGLLAFCMRHTITMNSNTLYMDVQNVWR